MFEGYMVSMKDHISKELSKLMTEVASANFSIAAVEAFVKTELATLRNGTVGVNMYGGDLFSGYSPAIPSPTHGPSSPSRQRDKGTAETRVDVEDSPKIDELDGNAAIRKETVTAAMPTSSSGVDVFVDVSEPSSSIPSSDGGNAVVSASAEAGTTLLQPPVSSLVTSEVSFTNSGFPSSAIVYSTNFRLIFVGTYFHQTNNPQALSTLLSSPFSAPLSDTPPPASSSVVEVPSDVSHTNTEVAPGSTVDAIPTELHVLPSSNHEAGRAVKLTTVVPSQACIRYSKRERRNPDRYTPSKGPEKQEPGKRARRGAKEKENVVASVAEPSIPIKETTSLIGGFTPFLPPNPVKRATLLEAMKDDKNNLPTARSGSPKLQWFTQVDILHIPVLMIKREWFGVIVDLNMWAMYVVEANPGCPSEFELTSVLTAASILFPHLIGRYCMTNHAQKRNFEPMNFSRLDMPCVVEHPGCSAVVALMLLEMHAVGKDVTVMKFTEEQVQTAGDNYAVDALHLCQAVPIPFTQ
uniref:Ubiquitin-like protease family profile domain-containing protein n=1 Tax=Brassica campestris TaxID=3711 RepID=M4E648_BRACM